MKADLLLTLAAAWLTVADRPAKKDPAREEMHKLQGNWALVALESRGRQISAEQVQRFNCKLVIKGNQFSREIRTRTTTMTFTIDPLKSPKTIDFQARGSGPNRTTLGIYELEGDQLKIRQGRAGQGRPTRFDNKDQAGLTMVFKRVRP